MDGQAVNAGSRRDVGGKRGLISSRGNTTRYSVFVDIRYLGCGVRF